MQAKKGPTKSCIIRFNKDQVGIKRFVVYIKKKLLLKHFTSGSEVKEMGQIRFKSQENTDVGTYRTSLQVKTTFIQMISHE